MIQLEDTSKRHWSSLPAVHPLRFVSPFGAASTAGSKPQDATRTTTQNRGKPCLFSVLDVVLFTPFKYRIRIFSWFFQDPAMLRTAPPFNPVSTIRMEVQFHSGEILVSPHYDTVEC
jgi:hypothetical protein